MLWQIFACVILFCVYKFYQRRRYKEKLAETFDDRHVFITGCDAGFGYDLAIRLDKLGFRVFAGCFTNVGEDELKLETSRNVTTVRIDVRDNETIKNAVQVVKDSLPEGKGLWGLVNNAGIYGNVAHVEWLSKKDYEDVMNTNVYGMIEVTRHFLPLLRQERGRIINMSSIIGRFAVGCTPYAVASRAIEAYSDRLRQDLIKTGVTVHIMEPGFYRTDLFDFDDLIAQFQESWEKLSTEVKEYYGKQYGNTYGDRALYVLETISNLNYDAVCEACAHALTAKYPQWRYLIGKDANRIFLPLSWIPEKWSDRFVTLRDHFPHAVALKECKNTETKTETCQSGTSECTKNDDNQNEQKKEK